MSHVPYLDQLHDRGLFAQFYDPEGRRYGLPTYPYHWVASRVTSGPTCG